MEISYLKEFVTLAQSCNFMETADELYISQSSLSKHIKAIEKDLGHELLNRSTRRVELSDFGRAFLPYATQIASIHEEFTENLLHNTNSNHIRVGFSHVVTLYTLQKYFASSYFPMRGRFNVSFEEHSRANLIAMLSKNEYDMIVAPTLEGEFDVSFPSIVYARDRLSAVLSEKHPLADKPFLTVDDIREFPLVQKGMQNFARILDPSIPPAECNASRDSIFINFIRDHNAIGIVPYYTAKGYLNTLRMDDIMTLDIVPDTEIVIRLYYPVGKSDSVLIRSIAEFLELKQELLKEYGHF